MKVVVYTLGCKVNQYDSDSIIAGFLKKGYAVTDKMERADVYVINTCAVTAEAERKSRQIMQRAKSLNPDAKIFVVGCASQNNPKQFADKGADCILGTANKIAVCDFDSLPLKSNANECQYSLPTAKVFEETGVASTFKTRHFIKVQDGCDNFCNYCLVPYLRGKPRSRSLENILNEVSQVAKSAKEIVLTGINLSAYGSDINLDLALLLDALKPYDIRVRLGSLEVNVVDDRLLYAAKNLGGFCDHFHLSLQSGSDKVLREMNRHYTSSEYFSAVEKIRSYFPEAAITTDLIVGYPTETDKDFADSLEFADKVAFADMHVFTFSPRKGTEAYKLKPLDPKVLAKRQSEASALKRKLKDKYNSSFLGRPLEVLFESESNGYMSGHSKNYITVYSKGAKHNEIKTVTPDKLFSDGVTVKE